MKNELAIVNYSIMIIFENSPILYTLSFFGQKYIQKTFEFGPGGNDIILKSGVETEVLEYLG